MSTSIIREWRDAPPDTRTWAEKVRDEASARPGQWGKIPGVAEEKHRETVASLVAQGLDVKSDKLRYEGDQRDSWEVRDVWVRWSK